MRELLSFEITSDFAFFNKPDINHFKLTYNLPPKTTILGLLGSLIGLPGLKEQKENEEYPKFYEKLSNLIIGVTPPSDKFPFNKTIIVYNSKNSYFGSEKYEVVQVKEQLLIEPKYEIHITSTDNNEYFNKIKSKLLRSKTIFTPYLGKNEFLTTIKNVKITGIEELKNHTNTKINSIFIVSNNFKKITSKYDLKAKIGDIFEFYENYPIGYVNGQYERRLICYTNKSVDKKDIDLKKGKLFKTDEEKNIYLF